MVAVAWLGAHEVAGYRRGPTPARGTIQWLTPRFWMISMPGRLRGFLAASERRQAVNKASVELALLTPSVAAEVAPLFLLWHFHLPVRQMSAIMVASWAFTWWLTWTLYPGDEGHGECPLNTNPIAALVLPCEEFRSSRAAGCRGISELAESRLD